MVPMEGTWYEPGITTTLIARHLLELVMWFIRLFLFTLCFNKNYWAIDSIIID